MSIKLTTIGSQIRVDVGPSALREADGGVAIRYGLFDGPLIVTFTRAEAEQLVAAIQQELDAGADGTRLDRLVDFYDTSGSPNPAEESELPVGPGSGQSVQLAE